MWVTTVLPGGARKEKNDLSNLNLTDVLLFLYASTGLSTMDTT